MSLRVTNLSGFGVGGSLGPVSSFEFVDSNAVGNATNLICPTVKKGDVAIYMAYYSGEGNGAVPSGFSQIFYPESGTGIDHQYAYKICVGNESGSTLINQDFSQTAVMIFRPDGIVSSVTLGDTDTCPITGANPDPITVASGSDTPPLIVFVIFSASTAITSESLSPTSDGSIDTSITSFHYKIFNTSPSNVTADMGDEGSGNWITGCSIQFS